MKKIIVISVGLLLFCNIIAYAVPAPVRINQLETLTNVDSNNDYFVIWDASDEKAKKVSIPTLVQTGLTGTITTAATVYPSNNGTSSGSMVTIMTISALANDVTIAAPAWTPVDLQGMAFRIVASGGPWTFTWADDYNGLTTAPLPETISSGATLYLSFIYNSVTGKWDCVYNSF